MAEYIEREAALKLAHYDDHDVPVIDVENIEALPAADVAPVRHGVWVPTPCPGIENGYLVVCSKCKAEIYVANDFNPSNYCPNCGAKMDEDARHAETDR
jgi:predicted RNA-binding Zn-ribbon protein involved in translation (DUF1610 family)